jgi:hypothetical protein
MYEYNYYRKGMKVPLVTIVGCKTPMLRREGREGELGENTLSSEMVYDHLVAVRHTYFGSSVETRHYTHYSFLALLPLPEFVLVDSEELLVEVFKRAKDPMRMSSRLSGKQRISIKMNVPW